MISFGGLKIHLKNISRQKFRHIYGTTIGRNMKKVFHHVPHIFDLAFGLSKQLPQLLIWSGLAATCENPGKI